MKKLLLASAIAVASAVATVAPADAHVFLGFGMGGYEPYPFYGGPYYGCYRNYSDDYYPGYVVRYPHYRYYGYHRYHRYYIYHHRYHHRHHYRHHHRYYYRY